MEDRKKGLPEDDLENSREPALPTLHSLQEIDKLRDAVSYLEHIERCMSVCRNIL